MAMKLQDTDKATWQLIENCATITLIAASVLAAMLFLYCAFQAISYPYPLDYGEAPLVNQAMRLAQGENIYYPNLSAPPYTISNYPPLYVLIMSLFIKIFGPSFVIGRVISTISALVSAISLSLIVCRQTKDRLGAFVSGTLMLSMPFVAYWTCLARVDLLALALSLSGLCVLMHHPVTPKKTLVSSLLLVAAIYTRQTYVLAAPLAAFIWLWARQREQAWQLAGTVGGGALGLFLILNVVTQGGFYFNIITANVNTLDFEWLLTNLRRLGNTFPLLILIGGVFIVRFLVLSHSYRSFAVYLVGATLSGLTIAKIGSNVNYFLEFCAALSLITGIAVFWLREHIRLHSVLVILLVLQVGWMMRTTSKEYLGMTRISPETLEEIQKLESIVTTSSGPILADEYMGLMTLQGEFLYIQPFEVTQLAKAGLWDQTQFLQDIKDRKFPAVFLHWSITQKARWTPEALFTINQTYAPVDFSANTCVYRPIEQDSNAFQVCPKRSELSSYKLDSFSLVASLVEEQVWHSPKLVPSSEEQLSPLSPPLNLGDQLQFLGYDVDACDAQRATCSLTTAWRVTAPPDGPWAIFVHLLAPDGEVVAQWDGLDVPVQGWRVGDTFLQKASFDLPADLGPGRYWLQTGVYNPETMKRLPVLTDGEPIADRILLTPIEIDDQ